MGFEPLHRAGPGPTAATAAPQAGTAKAPAVAASAPGPSGAAGGTASAPVGVAEAGVPAGTVLAYLELKSISKEEFAAAQPTFINAVASVGPFWGLLGS